MTRNSAPVEARLTVQISAIIWDLDGVLADTFDFHFQTWQQALALYGIPLSRDQYLPFFGQSPNEMRRILEMHNLGNAFPEIRRQKEALFNKMAGLVQPVPGSLPWLQALSLRFPQAVASSAPMPIIEQLLAILHIRPYFQALASGAEMNSKPAPDVFLRAASLLGVQPEKCLVIEDSPCGVEAAKTAGMRCIGLGTTSPLSHLLQADILLKDFSVLPFGEDG